MKFNLILIMDYQIGVIGSSNGDVDFSDKAREVGLEIAKSGSTLLTGACTGVPQAAVQGGEEADGSTIGISPANDREEHVERFGYPVDGFDSLIFTGLGLKGRNVVLVRSCDAVIAIDGKLGTLNELTIAHGERKVIGLLRGVSGASEEFDRVSEEIGRSGRVIIGKEDPSGLVSEVLDSLNNPD